MAKKFCEDHINEPFSHVIDKTFINYGKTPEALQRIHLESMAKKMDMDITLFCEKIIKMNTKEQFDLIKSFYSCQNITLKTFFDNFDEYKNYVSDKSMSSKCENKKRKQSKERIEKKKFIGNTLKKTQVKYKPIKFSDEESSDEEVSLSNNDHIGKIDNKKSGSYINIHHEFLHSKLSLSNFSNKDQIKKNMIAKTKKAECSKIECKEMLTRNYHASATDPKVVDVEKKFENSSESSLKGEMSDCQRDESMICSEQKHFSSQNNNCKNLLNHNHILNYVETDKEIERFEYDSSNMKESFNSDILNNSGCDVFTSLLFGKDDVNDKKRKENKFAQIKETLGKESNKNALHCASNDASVFKIEDNVSPTISSTIEHMSSSRTQSNLLTSLLFDDSFIRNTYSA